MPDQIQHHHSSLVAIRIVYAIYKISEKAYSFLFRRFLFIAPLPYAIGNHCEEIKYSLIAASISRKKLVLLTPPMGLWQKLLSYKHCNQSLYQSSVRYSQATIGKYQYLFLNTIYRIIFIFLRIIYLSIGKRRFLAVARSHSLEISGVSDYISFARYGIADMWNTLVHCHMDATAIQQTNEEVSRFRSILKETSEHLSGISKLDEKYNLHHDKKIIVMHFRSGKYHGDGNRRNRNANIENYQEAIEHLAMNNTCKIIIIGDENNLVFNNELDILNLPRLMPNLSERRSFEIYALCSATWYIGTQSGPWDLAMLLGLSTVIFNSIDLSTAQSTCWSNTVFISKQINNDKSINSWIDTYECDITRETGGYNSYQNINSSYLFTQICNALILDPKEKEDESLMSMSPIEYYSKSNFSIKTKHILAQIGGLHHLNSREIDDIVSKLIDKWGRLAKSLDLESEADFFSYQIIRLIAKRKLSKPERSLCFLDKEGFNE